MVVRRDAETANAYGYDDEQIINHITGILDPPSFPALVYIQPSGFRLPHSRGKDFTAHFDVHEGWDAKSKTLRS